MQQSRLTRIVANLVGMMLFVQVILGGSYIFLGDPPIIAHLVWGTLTFIVLIIATALSAKTFGTGSNLVKVGLTAIIDFVIQGLLGLFSFQGGLAVVVHLTNAFVLAILVTYLISFADSADKASLARTQSTLTGKVPSQHTSVAVGFTSLHSSFIFETRALEFTFTKHVLKSDNVIFHLGA